MATRKKTPDASEVGLSAIEEALGLSDDKATTAAGTAPDVPPALPKVDDFDIFKAPAKGKDEPSPVASPRPDAAKAEKSGESKSGDAKHAGAVADVTANRDAPKPATPDEEDAPFRRITPRRPGAGSTGVDIPGLSIRPDTAKAADMPKSADAAKMSERMPEEATVRLDKRPVEAAMPEPEQRRAAVLPANDDRRASVAELLEPLRNPAPRTPYVFAVLLSLVWLIGAYLLFTRSDGLLYAADGAMRAGQEGLLILAAVATLLPVMFFFALASLQRRSREMRTTSRVMAEVAARLVEPEVPGSETVFTLGQAVRREVSSIGDGIDRAITRATELEGLVHGEVTALERSYADNEYKMRTLVTGLTAEREAIMATAERIRLTIDAAHQGFSADIEKASSSISSAIDDAGTRVSFLLGGKQDELVATLDRTANHASELIQLRSNELAEKVNSVSRDTADALTITGNSIISDLTRVAQSSTTTLAEQTALMAREIDSTSQRSLEAMRASGDTLIQDWRAATEASQIEIAGIADQSARLLRDSAEISASTIRSVADEATTAFRSTADEATTRFSAAATDSASLVTTSVEQATGDFTKATSSAASLLVSSAEKAAADFSSSANATASLLTSSLESATDTFRVTGEALKSEIGETADIVNSAFETNSRAIIEQIGSSAIQLNETMQQAGLTFISTIEERGNTAAERIEQAGHGVAVRIAEKSDQLSNHASLLATHISNGTTKLQTLLEDHEATIATSFETASSRLDGTLSERASRLDQSLAFRATAIEQVLGERVSALDHTLAERASAIEAILAERVDTLDQSLAGHAITLANIVENRVTLANEAFAIAGESLGALIADRTRESSLGLKNEIDELGLALAQQSAQATERLATTGRDVVQAMTAHGQKVNDALAANAMRLAETVSERTAGLSERFSGFEKTFIEKAANIETTVSTHGDELVNKIATRAETLTGNLESLVARIETGLDSRTKSLGDAIALRAIEFNRLVGENSATLLGGLDERVGLFTSKVVTPLEAQLAAIEGRTTLAAEALTGKLDQSSEALVLRAKMAAETVQNSLQSGSDTLVARATTAADEITTRLDRSADAINLRVSEVQRGLTDLSRNVSTELVSRADALSRELSEKSDAIAALFDTKGSGFLTAFEGRARALVSGLEASTGDLTQRVTTSLEELNTAITSGSESSLGGLVEANNRLKSEVSELLGRLGEANGLLNTIVGAASQNLTEVESRMAERVRGLESTLAAILSAANHGSDALVKQVDQIRSASGDVLRHSQGLTQDLDGRAATLQRLASDLANSQAQVAQLVGDRQDAFETLASTLQSRIEDVDNMLRSFSALVDEQLGEAQSKAREAAALVHETAETAAQSIGAQYDRLRLESGKERERTAVALRSAYDQANGEMSTLFQRATDGFMATAAELRQATREMMADLEATRAAVNAGGLEIPREVREATANLKRVVSDQSRALNELSEIVSRSNAAFDVAEPRRAEAPPSRLSEAELPRLTPQRPVSRPVAPTPPREMPRTGGGSWLSGLLERASDEPPAPLRQREPAPSNANRIESLDSLSVDIARMIDHEAAVDLWDRYRKGERNVFTRRLYTLQGQEAYDDIRRRYKRDTEFKRTTDAYLDQFERLLQEVAGDDRDNLVARTYLTSDTGKVYTMLAHAAGRFD